MILTRLLGVDDTSPTATHATSHASLDGNLMGNPTLSSQLGGADQHTRRATGIELRESPLGKDAIQELRHEAFVSKASVLRRATDVHVEILEVFSKIQVARLPPAEKDDALAVETGKLLTKSQERRDSNPSGNHDGPSTLLGYLERRSKRPQAIHFLPYRQLR
jgi:hypothetical protein